MCKCAECGNQFKLKQNKQSFCQPACKQAFYNRTAKRGKQLTLVAMAAREKRGSETAKWAMTERDRLCAQWRAEDAAAGRMSAGDYISRQRALCLRA